MKQLGILLLFCVSDASPPFSHQYPFIYMCEVKNIMLEALFLEDKEGPDLPLKYIPHGCLEIPFEFVLLEFNTETEISYHSLHTHVLSSIS